MNHVSASSMGTFLRCQRQWRFRYVEGLIQPPGVAMVQGTSLHAGAEYNFAYKMEAHEDAPLDDVLDVARDTFERESERIEQWEGDEPGPAKDAAVNLTKVYHAELAPTVQPVAVEREFLLTDDSWTWPVLGYQDVLDEAGVIDIKTSGKKKTQSELDTSLQGGIYLLERHMAGEPERFSWHVAVKTKTPSTQILERTRVEPDRVKLTIGRVQSAMLQVMDTGLAMPAEPGSWACSERFCGYYKQCEYGGKR